MEVDTQLIQVLVQEEQEEEVLLEMQVLQVLQEQLIQVEGAEVTQIIHQVLLLQ